MAKPNKFTQGTKQKGLTYTEILKIIAEQKDNENAFPSSFAIKINKILDAEETQAE